MMHKFKKRFLLHCLKDMIDQHAIITVEHLRVVLLLLLCVAGLLLLPQLGLSNFMQRLMLLPCIQYHDEYSISPNIPHNGIQNGYSHI